LPLELRRALELRLHVYLDGFTRGAWMSASLWLGGCSCLLSTKAHPFAARADSHHWRLRPVLAPLGLQVIGAGPSRERGAS
jgi:hypothetical protein